MPLQVAAYQLASASDLDAALRALQAADPAADVACFPECFLQGYLTDRDLAQHQALDLRSPQFDQLLDQLSTVRPMLVFGLIERDNAKLYNTAVVVHRGQLVGKYRKRNLLAGESLFTAGDSDPIFEVGDTTFGINICFDLQFPESAASLVRQGASLLLCPCNNMMRRATAEKYKYLHHQLRRRLALENNLWIISSDVTGPPDAERICYGPTSAINPSGAVVAQVPLFTPDHLSIQI